MKKIIFNSLKTKISLVFLLLVFVTVSGIVFYMQLEVEKANLEEQDKNVKTLLASVKLNVENQNNSIFFHKNAMIDARKEELMNVVTLAINSIQSYYSMYKKGIINEKTAKLLAMNELKKFRYKNGTGYIWINDTGKPYPHMVMHPTLPELDGKIMDSPEYNCALGKDINLFHAFIDVTEKFGEGYVHYLWPKPTNEGLTEKQPKLSYVRLFKDWNWIVGSGLYMDDIEEEVEKRIIAIENEFKKTFAKIKIAENGYMFLFNHERKVIVHPIYENMELSKLINPATGNKILDDLIEASTTLDEKINYIWDKPADMGNFIYKKVAYVTYFEPLNWYIGLSFYIDEIEASAEALRKKILIFSLIFLTASIFAGIYFAHRLTNPLKKITTAFSSGAEGDYSIRLKINSNDEFGRLTKYFNNFMNEIENSHNKLSISEKRFRTLFEKSADARLIIEDGKFVDCNEALIKMLGYDNKEQVLYKNPSDLSPEFQPDGAKSDKKAKEMINKAYEKEVYRFEWNHVRANGDVFPAAIELTSIEYEGKTRLHVLWRDISEQKRTEQQLLQSQKMETVGTLAGGLAHDFNNILSGILGTASLIKNKIKLNKKIKEEKLIEYINTIEKSGNRAADLVQQLLTVSSKQELSLNPIDLNVAIIHILKVAQNSFDKSIDLRPVYYPEKAIVKADLTQIEQVILNLCVNAAHSMTIMRAKNEKWGGALDIQIDKVYSDHHFIKNHPEAKNIDYWILSIRDTGIGIRKEQLAKIFTPFFTTKDKGKGTGLGLSMVYNIINQHNGFIDIYSEEGIGTTFDIYLPVLKDEEFYEQKPVSEEKIPKGEGLILIIDDEDILRETAKIILNECGYETIFATNGIEGLEIFKEQIEDIKIVLLDMVMPKMSGKETYIELKKIKKDVKVLLVSGFKQDERVQSVLKLGINGFVQKPYTMEKLASAINTIIVN